MIFLEDYDLPVIALNVNMFLTAIIFVFTGWFAQIIDYIATGDADVFWLAPALLYLNACLVFGIMVVFTFFTDIWWISQKTRDNRRWL